MNEPGLVHVTNARHELHRKAFNFSLREGSNVAL
jgi:hypothetical protein